MTAAACWRARIGPVGMIDENVAGSRATRTMSS